MSDKTGQRFGDYCLLRSLGGGTFGDVYYAEHVYQKSPAAVKVFKTKLTPHQFKQFINEVRTVLLRHPNIVPIIDFGIREDDDLGYIVMEYAPNGTLRHRHPRGTRIPLSALVAYVKQIASALQYAHDNRRIHRDVKPENLLLGANNEIWLSDFGIVAVAHTLESQRPEKRAGSPIYMAPEQWRERPHPASDQYALGIMVYEWLCGEPPFMGKTGLVSIQHIQDPPPPLREKNPTIPIEVEQVVMKSLEKDPQKRFQSVQAFAEAFEQAYNLHAPRVTLYTYSGHTSGPVAWSPDGRYIASGSLEDGVHVWEALTGKNRLTYTGHKSSVGVVVWSPDSKYIASGSLEDGVHVWVALTGKNRLTYTGHKSSVGFVAWSPDGRYIASSGDDHTFRVWEALTGKNRLNLTDMDAHGWAAWSPDGRYIASGSLEDGVHVWEALTGKNRLTYTDHMDYITTLAWSPDGRYIASSDGENTIHVWEALTGKNRLTYTGHTSDVYHVAWSPDSKYIASSEHDDTVHVWEALTGKKLFYNHTSFISCVVWSPDGRYIASSDFSDVQVWRAV